MLYSKDKPRRTYALNMSFKGQQTSTDRQNDAKREKLLEAGEIDVHTVLGRKTYEVYLHFLRNVILPSAWNDKFPMTCRVKADFHTGPGPHPKRFATAAREDDPSYKLAFKVSGKFKDGTPFEHWLQNDGEKVV